MNVKLFCTNKHVCPHCFYSAYKHALCFSKANSSKLLLELLALLEFIRDLNRVQAKEAQKRFTSELPTPHAALQGAHCFIALQFCQYWQLCPSSFPKPIYCQYFAAGQIPGPSSWLAVLARWQKYQLEISLKYIGVKP